MEAFSDGIFAIAATLLVLNIQVPRGQATQVLGTHIGVPGDATPAALLYAVTGILIAFGYAGVYPWIATHSELVHERFAGVSFLRSAPCFLVGSVAYAACIPLAFFYPHAAASR